jgi:hypothetical protein
MQSTHFAKRHSQGMHKSRWLPFLQLDVPVRARSPANQAALAREVFNLQTLRSADAVI